MTQVSDCYPTPVSAPADPWRRTRDGGLLTATHLTSLPSGIPEPEAGSEADHLGHQGAERQVLVQGNAPEDRLHLRDT